MSRILDCRACGNQFLHYGKDRPDRCSTCAAGPVPRPDPLISWEAAAQHVSRTSITMNNLYPAPLEHMGCWDEQYAQEGRTVAYLETSAGLAELPNGDFGPGGWLDEAKNTLVPLGWQYQGSGGFAIEVNPTTLDTSHPTEVHIPMTTTQPHEEGAGG